MTTATRTRRGYSRDNVETHAQGYYGPHLPAVNVKVHGDYRRVSLPLDLGRVSDDGGATWQDVTTAPGFSHEWIEAHISEELAYSYWEMACQSGYEQAGEIAAEIWPGADVHSEGRSGGWLVVDNGPDSDLTTWDAVALAKWRKFERACGEIVADIPRAFLESVYMNEWEAQS